jgi:hypothetical protein
MPAEAGEESLRAAHARLLADRSLQFQLEAAKPPPDPPDWLRGLFRFLDGAAPALQWLFWGLVALILGAIVWFTAREILLRRRADRVQRAPPLVLGDLQPTAERAQALLGDADRLAAEGRYAEAAHLLLLRSVADIQAARPAALGPSMTSRDIARWEALPGAARGAFARMAEVVERSLFGGRDVDAATYGACREAYAAFALPTAWR